jgi:hypothetical protein
VREGDSGVAHSRCFSELIEALRIIDEQRLPLPFGRRHLGDKIN